MTATYEDVQQWIEDGKRMGAKYIISVCDTFDWDDYPIYVRAGENLEEIKAKYAGVNMQKINEVIEL